MSIVEGSAGRKRGKSFPIDLNSICLVEDQLTSHAVRFIESTRDLRLPFFLYDGTRGAHNDSTVRWRPRRGDRFRIGSP